MEWIDEIIVGLLDTYGTNDVYELCNYLNIEIRNVSPNHTLLDGCKSYYYRYFTGKEIIFISNDIEVPFREFFIKHELGHALCNAELSCSNFPLSNRDKLEKQANYFAIKLSDIKIDEVYLKEMTLEQIAMCLELPYEPLRQLEEVVFM